MGPLAEKKEQEEKVVTEADSKGTAALAWTVSCEYCGEKGVEGN